MKKIKVCVVDDDHAYTYLVKLVIRAVGPDLDIMTFTDGDYAIDFISAHVSDTEALPDIILLDINMPRMDGWGFLEEYAKIADRISKKISIYILSSSISDADLSKGKENPLVTDYIVKPLEEEKFKEVMNAFGPNE